jgi:glycosyltransferase involved in cell wall biosynthesis
VVVPVRDGAESIGGCIASLLACDYPGEHEIIVVDNGSSDATAEIVRSHPVTYLYEPRRGVSHARNRGIEASEAEIVALLDGDCVVGPGWMREIVAPFSDPAIGAVGGELENMPPGTVAERQAERLLGRWQRYAMSSAPPYAVTANAAFRRGVFERVGLFDPEMPRAQDVEFGHRFDAGSDLGLAFSPAALARHRHATTARGFFRQQLGWAYGAGLLAHRMRLAGRPSEPPKLSYVTTSARGLLAVLLTFPRGYGERVWLEDAWFTLLRNLAWWTGIRAGRLRAAARRPRG